VKPAPFQYVRPESTDEAVAALEEHDDPTLLAGGQSLIATMNGRLATPETMVDISHVEDLDYIREESGDVAIGAMTTQSTAESSETVIDNCPLVAEALSNVGHETIRNKGTIGGNLAHADPTSELPSVALLKDATFVLRGPDGKRTVDAEDFFLGHLTTDVRPNEMLTEIRFPTLPDGHGWSFEEVAPVEGGYPIVGVAATLETDGETCQRPRLAYTAVSDRPIRVPEAETEVEGQPAATDTFEAAAEIASEAVDPPSDVHGSSDYRRRLVKRLTRDALEQSAERAEGY
jgi:CO/xanthine dehydrogenase FAD-binding subunit